MAATAAPARPTFTTPDAWTRRDDPKFVELTAPEGDTRLAIVDVASAADARAAVAAAWKLWKPDFARPPKLVTLRAARNGWDERQVVDYEVSPNEKRGIQAVAFRAGTGWTVLILDGSEATLEKRGAAVGLVLQSLRPAGYARETFAGRTPLPMTPERIAQLQAFVGEAMQQLGIPGAAFALTDRKGTIYSTGLGVRELGRPAKVSADSEFMIASNTKGMSTLLLAKLVDEGRLTWDQPVTQLYPAFKLGSADTTSKVLVRHLVCACTGLPRKDMEWLFNTNSASPASGTFTQLAATAPTSGFGEVFQYNNLMASAAGYLGGHLAYPGMELGKAYDRAMEEKIFKPLGMTATTFDYAKAMAGDWARPHGDSIDGATVAFGNAGMKLNRSVIPYRPAGGAWSTANDLIKYVRFELNEGRLDNGTQWVSAKNLLERRAPFVPVGEDRFYGMGMQTDRDLGVDVVHHGGSMFGYKSDIMLVPSAGIGAVILTNAEDGQSLLRPFMRRLLELIYDGKPEAAGDVAAAAARIKAEFAKERQLIALPPDPAAVAALAGAYTSPELGPLKIEKRGPDVLFSFTTVTSKAATKKNDDGSISFVMTDPTIAYAPVVVAKDGDRRALIIRDGQHEYRFAEVR
ncbi:serine hydrolase domain-containing protein [Glacieibacterium frigidum]|uniref:serine hydrolase domain-containing protein n=1 Tax=Glacieibacterium frigidum TaxID=2593303 RepID=UPI001A9C5D8A|nr:serine hydrolase domain-containing protein [Glacieibacterium frigidum]